MHDQYDQDLNNERLMNFNHPFDLIQNKDQQSHLRRLKYEFNGIFYFSQKKLNILKISDNKKL